MRASRILVCAVLLLMPWAGLVSASEEAVVPELDWATQLPELEKIESAVQDALKKDKSAKSLKKLLVRVQDAIWRFKNSSAWLSVQITLLQNKCIEVTCTREECRTKLCEAWCDIPVKCRTAIKKRVCCIQRKVCQHKLIMEDSTCCLGQILTAWGTGKDKYGSASEGDGWMLKLAKKLEPQLEETCSWESVRCRNREKCRVLEI